MIVISFQKELNRVDDRTTPEQDSALRSAMLGLAQGEQTEKYMTLHSGQTCERRLTMLYHLRKGSMWAFSLMS